MPPIFSMINAVLVCVPEDLFRLHKLIKFVVSSLCAWAVVYVV